MRRFFGASGDDHRAPWHVRHRFLIAACLVCGVFVLATGAHAQVDVDGRVLGLLGLIMGEIISFMGKFIILLVSILISFASYNNFLHAQPVEIGWVLMRDVANMFFIVILLVSAFSTIVGYSEFHYTKVLPKLLLMAVLINFSKTLIGLLVDFSQVLMLTFVNAFRQAAGGNFVSALKLSKVTAIDPYATDLKVSGSLIPAAILAIVLLGISMTLLVIMIAFILARIIGIWLLLIMSPMAFFALALPGKLSKAMAPFTSKFWDRLSTVLIGGPVMAFFLWLALAVVQGSGEPFKDMYTATAEATSFATAVGNASDLASFTVAIAFMLMGVEFAVSTAGALSKTLGKFAAGAAAGGGVAVLGARYASRLGRKSAGVAFEGVDRLADVRGKVGRAGLAISGRIGGIGGATFMGMAGHKTMKIKEKQAEQAKNAANLDPVTRLKYLRKLQDSKVFGRAATAAQLSLADDATTGLGLKARTKALMAEAEKRTDLTTDAEKKAWAEARAHQQAAADIKIGQDAATALGDEAKFDKYKEAIKKNPALGVGWGALAATREASVEDVNKYLNTVSSDSVKDSGVFLAHMAALGLIDEDTGAFNRDADPEAWDKFMDPRSDRGKFAREHINNLTPEQVKAQLSAISGNTAAIEEANAARRFASKADNGKVGSVYVNQGGVQVAMSAKIETPEEKQARGERLSRAEQRVQTFASRGAEAATSDEAQRARIDLLAAGGSISKAYGFSEEKGQFQDADQRFMFDEAMKKVATGVAGGDDASIKLMTEFNISTIKAKPDEYNEARSRTIAHLTPDVLVALAKKAETDNDQALRQKVKNILGVIETEAKRVQKVAADAGVKVEDLEKMAANPMSAASSATSNKLVSGGHVRDESAAEDAARAVASAKRIRSEEGFREIRGDRSPRAQARVTAARARSNRGGTRA